ncbi:MAG TPA: M23 family metallopeptidase [Puia sp.]|nr:M23 family metallopeptidase [Puia sp.]
MKYSFVLVVFVIFSSPSFSQKILEINYDQDAQGNTTFYCNNSGYCDFILQIEFTSLNNATADRPLPYREEIKPGKTRLFKLSKQVVENPMGFRFKTTYVKGCMMPKINPDFIYLLPIAPGKEAQAYEMVNLNEQKKASATPMVNGQELIPNPKDWYVIRLRMKPGDTIYSARRGVVTEVQVNSNLNDSGVASAGHENYLEIVHEDCSFGHYGVFKRNSAFVKPGQTVEAGQPIGLVGGDRFGRGSEARFSVFYNIQTTDSQNVKGVFSAYVPLKFWTRNNGASKLRHGASYVCEDPPQIINQEKIVEAKKPKPKAKPKSGAK